GSDESIREAITYRAVNHDIKACRPLSAQVSSLENMLKNSSTEATETAATAIFLSTCGRRLIPTSAVVTPGVDRTNWMARWASVLKPFKACPTKGGRFCASFA